MLDVLPQMIQGFQGISLLNDGADMAEQGGQMQAGAFRAAGNQALEGGKYSAAVYRNSGVAARSVANYNIELERVNASRGETALSNEMVSMFAKNRVVQGSSGFSFGSKSYLAVSNAAMNNLTNKVIQDRNTSWQKQQQINFEGQLSSMTAENQARNAEYQGEVAKVNYENQARQAEYQGEVAAYQAKSKGAQSIGGLFTNIGDTLLNA